MKVLIDKNGQISDLEKKINQLAADGYNNIMIFHGEGGIDSQSQYKKNSDAALRKAQKNNIQIFGGIFPGIFDDGQLMTNGSIITGIRSTIHVVTLEDLNNSELYDDIKEGLAPVLKELEDEKFKTLFVFGDGFGENNLNLINGLNRFVKDYPIKVIGGMTGRAQIKASHYTIFTPGKIIQNGAVLAFTQLESSIGVQHGWVPLLESELEVTKINDCFVEEINGAPALDFYMHVISSADDKIDSQRDELIKDPDKFFTQVAVQYPLGLIREQDGNRKYIDRTPIAVGGDRSLQFSSQIPVGTRASILQLRGESPLQQCSYISHAANDAYEESRKNLADGIEKKRVIIMDCFGRKELVQHLGRDYNEVEFKDIAQDQKAISHSPIGPLTFGEISSIDGNYVELHNKTAVVATIEDN